MNEIQAYIQHYTTNIFNWLAQNWWSVCIILAFAVIIALLVLTLLQTKEVKNDKKKRKKK